MLKVTLQAKGVISSTRKLPKRNTLIVSDTFWDDFIVVYNWKNILKEKTFTKLPKMEAAKVRVENDILKFIK